MVEYDEGVPKKKKGFQKSLKKRYEAGDPSVGLLGEPSGKFDYYVLYGDSPPKSKPKPCKPSSLRTLRPSQPKGMFMITPSPSTSKYKVEFPALTTFENPQQKTKHSWKIQSSNIVGPTGSPNQITVAESTLNWQSENAVDQNNSDVESISYDELSNREFEHLFMAEPEQTERVDSDIEDATSRAEAQDQAHGRNVFINTNSKQ
ncbi:hypothetical protein L1987_18610 [Smallanthus sonchifolius]|uniref:Uncharacterized protein n=1 Tax=Smallanthus sonchifolius TaxID=185202 RepID=A0ACB9J2T2_9ASTR|nr:hypothetical protein L1987_18610 [Smallanthus sonchifolius]